MKFCNNLDVNKNQLLNAKLQSVGGNPTLTAVTDRGLIWYDSGASEAKVSDGTGGPTSIQKITNVLEAITDGTGGISVGALQLPAKTQSVNLSASTALANGYMAMGDFAKLNGPTGPASLNTFSTLVQRDATGCFNATTVTAALAGNATTATGLGLVGQTSAWHLTRANHTGDQTYVQSVPLGISAQMVTNFNNAVKLNPVNTLAATTGTLAMATNWITGVKDPINGTDAANKQYVDACASGLDVKASVRVATLVTVGTYTPTAGPSLRGQLTLCPNVLDGVNLVAGTIATGNRILVKNHSTLAANGIYVCTTLGTGANGIWDRAADFDQDAEVTAGSFTFVSEGTQQTSGWVNTTDNPIIIGGATTPSSIVFAQFSGAGSFTAGAGMTQSGTTFNAIGIVDRITVNADSIDIASTYVGQTSIIKLGAVNNVEASWGPLATKIAVASGGTGAALPADARTNLGATGKWAQDVGDGLIWSYPISHGLATTDVTVSVYDKTTKEQVFVDVVYTSAAVITLNFSTVNPAPLSNAYRVIVVG